MPSIYKKIYIDFFESIQRWVVIGADKRGYITCLAEFNTKEKANKYLEKEKENPANELENYK